MDCSINNLNYCGVGLSTMNITNDEFPNALGKVLYHGPLAQRFGHIEFLIFPLAKEDYSQVQIMFYGIAKFGLGDTIKDRL